MPMPTPEEAAAAVMADAIAAARADIAAAESALIDATAMLDAIEHGGDKAATAGAYLEHRRNVRYNNAVAQSTGHVLNEARISL